jgi:hypothetical protein
VAISIEYTKIGREITQVWSLPSPLTSYAQATIWDLVRHDDLRELGTNLVVICRTWESSNGLR